VLESELEITPRPRRLVWTRDRFGNHVATAQFDDRAAELRFVSNIRLDHTPGCFHATDIAEFARTYPFAYAAQDWPRLRRFVRSPFSHPELERWSARFFRHDGSADTHDLVVEMTQAIRGTFKHVSRHETGIQDPVRTLDLGSGSCRDLAMFMIAVLRSRGFAARFVSGYLRLFEEADDDNDDCDTRGNTHAWVQVFVPGPGWVDFDPSGGIIGNQSHIRVAVAHHPRAAIPLQGIWYGEASDHLAMKVTVKVKAAVPEDVGRASPQAARTEFR
jgi:transglutaminase-like putative cysteine protease